MPLIGGAFLIGAKHWDYEKIKLETQVVTIITSIIVFCALFDRPEKPLVLFELVGNLKIMLKLDGLGSIFAGLVAFLWPFANMYAFEYMKHDKERKHIFFGFYIMTYGTTLGIAFSGNLLTMYLFYEVLTFVTMYLVLHPMTKKAIRATRQYLYYSLGGAVFGFFSIICLEFFGDTSQFVLGGVLDMKLVRDNVNMVLLMFVFAFCGFGVKAALFPFHGWLPKASVAPTPVTALLHAVAVVKSGAFAIIRIIYYSYGTKFLSGTWAQYVVMILAMATIVYGSTMAVKEIHIKRRLAYSTVSNLSYILLAATFMTPAGMTASVVHLMMHAFMKICGFFCIGAVMHQTGKNYMSEIEGMGRKMPIIFSCLTIAGIALAGIPPFAGFISKWNLVSAGLKLGTPMAMFAIAVLLYSSLLTAMYMGEYVIRAWFPRKGVELANHEGAKDPDGDMILPILVFTCVIVLLGLYSDSFVSLIQNVAQGLV